MNKSKVEWCDYMWNPITGCWHGCEYCYAEKNANRFSGHSEAYLSKPPHDLHRALLKYSKDCRRILMATYPFGFDPTFHRYRLNDPQKIKKPQNIFVVGMGDMFGSWVPDEWIAEVFKACEAAPQHRYMFLTKNPLRYVQLARYGHLPANENFWYGATVTNQVDQTYWSKTLNTFVSNEPMQSRIDTSDWGYAGTTRWLIVGAETGNRKSKIMPEREWVEEVVNACRERNIPVFLKNNLAEIWGEPLIQEYPWEV